MTFEHLAQYLQIVLGLLLVAKTFGLKEKRLYLVFGYLIAADLLGSGLWLLRAPWVPLFNHADYRMIWLIDRCLAWILTVWTVALLLNAVLVNYPGILSMSRRVLRYAWYCAAGIGAFSAVLEYAASQSMARTGWVGDALILGIVLERVVSSTSLLAMLAVLAFLVWFPVRIPRNLIYLCVGFVVYFAIITISFIAHSFVWHDSSRYISAISISATALCYAFWFSSLSKAGNTLPTQMTLNWDARHQQILLQQLEGLNHSLLRAARR